MDEYNKKYNNKSNDIFNIEINITKSLDEILCNIFIKLMEYSHSKNFLGELYEKENNDIAKMFNFNNIRNKILNKYYLSINQFNEELFLIFDNNEQLIKENNEINYKINQLKEYYQIIILKYKDIIFIKEKEEKNNKMINDNEEEINFL